MTKALGIILIVSGFLGESCATIMAGILIIIFL
jgi:hypothetical protein